MSEPAVLQTLVCPGSVGFLVHWGLYYELYVGVKGIKVGGEMLDLFILVDNKGVIHVPK